MPGTGIYAEKRYPEKRHVQYRFIWKSPRVEAEPVLEVGAETGDKAGKCQQASMLKKMT